MTNTKRCLPTITRQPIVALCIYSIPRRAVSATTSGRSLKTDPEALCLRRRSNQKQRTAVRMCQYLGLARSFTHRMICPEALQSSPQAPNAMQKVATKECQSKQHSNYRPRPPMPRQNLIENQRGHEIDKTTSPEDAGPSFPPTGPQRRLPRGSQPPQTQHVVSSLLPWPLSTQSPPNKARMQPR
jgi:hypothetical protein